MHNPSPPLPAGQVTFLFTDIVGSTRLWEQDAAAMRGALARHNAILAEVIAAHDGAVFKTVGDAFCAVFPAPPAALAAAVASQRALQAEPWPGAPLQVRMALHTGFAEPEAGDYVGPPLNRVARLLVAGHGGQVLLTLATQEQVAAQLPAGTTLRDLGEYRLKDLARPERVFQLVVPDLPAGFPPLRALEALAHNLPVALTSFVGREAEMAEARRLLAQTRLLTLTGPGGTGKTRLSLQVAAELLDQFPDGVWLVELAPLGDPALVPQALATVFGLREEPGQPVQTSVLAYLAARQLLLLLDNCEHLVAAAAQLAGAILRTCPGVQILASSREALGIAGETAWRVPSLAVPDLSQALAPAQLAAGEAVRLFAERAAQVQPGFAVDAGNARTVAQICARLDGIPLAIELAAARTRNMRVEQIAARLDDRFRLLTGGSRNALPRQQTLRALIDWSYDLLSADERRVLARLSVFAGGWTLEAAERVGSRQYAVGSDESVGSRQYAVGSGDEGSGGAGRGAGNDDDDGEDAGVARLQSKIQNPKSKIPDGGLGVGGRGLGDDEGGDAGAARLQSKIQNPKSKIADGGLDCFDALTGLVNKSLVVEPDAEGRYGYLETIRQYAREKLFESGEAAAVRAAHRDWFLHLAEEAERSLRGPEQLVWHRRLADEHDNLRAAFDWCKAEAEAGMPEGAPAALRLAGALGLWFPTRSLGEGRRWLEEALALPGATAPTAARAQALLAAGLLYYMLTDYPAARRALEESITLWRTLANPRRLAWALTQLAITVFYQGDIAWSRALSEESLALATREGDRWVEALAICHLGFAAATSAQAGVHFAESLALYRQVGDRQLIARLLNGLGEVARIAQDYTGAAAYYEESLALYQVLGQKMETAMLISNLGALACVRGDYDQAAQLFGQSLVLNQEAGSKRFVAGALAGLAQVAGIRGQGERAARLFGAAAAVLTAIGSRFDLADGGIYAASQAAVQAQLAPDIWAAAWAAGQALPLEQTIADALASTE